MLSISQRECHGLGFLFRKICCTLILKYEAGDNHIKYVLYTIGRVYILKWFLNIYG